MAEDDRRQTEELLGHNVYATSLAELLCEPSLELPLTVGIYSRWGSSKVHFFKRLQRMYVSCSLDQHVLRLGGGGGGGWSNDCRHMVHLNENRGTGLYLVNKDRDV